MCWLWQKTTLRFGRGANLFRSWEWFSGKTRTSASDVRPSGPLRVKDEFLRINQRPQDVLVGHLLVLGVQGQVGQRLFLLGGPRLAGHGPEEQLVHLLLVGARVLGELVGPAAAAAQLA